MADSSRAVFLSYASQDAPAAKRVCEALRAAGIEVWFDQSELRGGDAWDQKIRRELHDCTLFIPIVSANTAARHEGYFRLEWDLADQRTHMIARNRAFILPVCVDTTAETGADTPESFQRVQWTRLPGGETPPAFVERVQRLLSGADSVSDRPSSGSGAILQGAPGRGRAGLLYGAISLAAIIALGYLALERLKRPAPSVASAASIAVLPLVNESGDTNQRYFSDGISEDLITALGQFAGLKVIGRSSAFQFRDSKEDSRSIGAKLGVAHLLEGSVRKSGEMVRVSAELIDTADGTMQWSEHYDRPYKDLFALQDEITRAVAGALKVKLVLGEHATEQSDRPPGGSLDAYNAVLEGRFHASRGTEAEARKAIEYYTQAIELDPHYAFAVSNLSEAWITLGSEFLDGPAAQEAYAKARAASDHALALSPDLAAAHRVRGDLLQTADFDWRGADAEFRRAMELQPSHTGGKALLANLRATLGEAAQAADLLRQVAAAEPLSASVFQQLSTYLSGLNRPDEAEAAIRKAIELTPTAAGFHEQLAIIEVQRGDARAALTAAQQEPPGPFQDTALAVAHQIGGDRSTADAALNTLIKKDAGDAPYQIAEVYALRNDAKATFEWLDRAWNSHDAGIQLLLYDPFILRFKADPRFAAFCRKANLPVPGQTSASKAT